jgi:hypothetical protein
MNDESIPKKVRKKRKYNRKIPKILSASDDNVVDAIVADAPKGVSIHAKATKEVPYARFIFRFVESPGKTLHFEYERKRLGYTDGNEYHAPLEICHHLDGLKRGRYELQKPSDKETAVKVRVGEKQRCYAQVLETYQKEMR